MGFAPELALGFASWSTALVNEGVFWFVAGGRFSLEHRGVSFFAAAHAGYGHITDYNAQADGAAIDFSLGFLFHTTPMISFGPRFGTNYIDGFVPAGASQLWYDLGLSMQLNLRP